MFYFFFSKEYFINCESGFQCRVLEKTILLSDDQREVENKSDLLLLWIIYVISVLLLLCFRAHLFIDALWSPAEKGLISWLSFVMSNCKVVTFPLVSWVRCGA